jgi:hypothetical protein
MTYKATVHGRDNSKQATLALTTEPSFMDDVFSVHPSFTHQYNHSYVTLYKRRPNSSLSKLKSIKLSMVGDVLGVVLWVVSIPMIFSLGSMVVA